MTDAPSPPVLFVVSDGRGETAHQVVKAGLVQFPDQDFEIRIWSQILTTDQVADVVRAAADRRATIFYTLVGEDTRSAMKRGCRTLLVPEVDLLGPSLSALHDVFHRWGEGTPGLYYAAEQETIDRNAAIDYTLRHDDGRRPHELHQADVILVGVSRTSKSSTCFYLAYQGIKAANVPLVRGTPVAKELLEVNPAKVICLNMNVPRLITLREARAAHLGTKHMDYYLDRREVGQEVRFANELRQKYGWRHLNASYLAIEEIAREVIKRCELQARNNL